MNRRSMKLIGSICAVLLALPGTALASGDDVVRDCTDDGKLSKRYSQEEYRDALADLPTDVDEYTDCRDVIRKGQLGSAGGGTGGAGGAGGGTGSGGGGSLPGLGSTVDPASATPQEKQAIEQAAERGAATPVTLAGEPITPEPPGLGGLEGLSTIPTPLLVALGLLGAAGLAAGGAAGRKLVLARRHPA